MVSASVVATKRQQLGFTLVELLMVVVIIGILAAFMLPAYQTYTRNTQRTTAEGQLTNLAQAMENYKAQNFSYAGVSADCSGNVATLAPDLCGNKFYTVGVVINNNNQGYLITATPKSTMVGDGNLVLDNSGNSCHVTGSTCTPTSGSSW